MARVGSCVRRVGRCVGENAMCNLQRILTAGSA